MNFQLLVIIVAFITLLIALASIGYMMYSARYSVKFPPDIADCPDYWTSTSNGCQVHPQGYNQGTFTGTTASFSSPKYQGTGGIKEKCKWAKQHQLTWDTITNNPVCN